MFSPTTNDPRALGLAALAATLSDERRAGRFLDLTGLCVDELRARARAAEPGLLVAVLTFLEGHEPDLTAVAAEIGEAPAALVRAREELER